MAKKTYQVLANDFLYGAPVSAEGNVRITMSLKEAFEWGAHKERERFKALIEANNATEK